MNHPSDYEFEYHQSSSSDESKDNLSMQMRYSHTHYSTTKIISTSMVQHKCSKTYKKKKTKKKGKSTSKKSVFQSMSGKSKKAEVIKDFIILGDQYYHCDNIEQLSQRMIAPESARIMKEQRVKRKEKNCIGKIEKYLRTFVHCRHQSSLQNKNRYEKIELYQMLREEEQEVLQQKYEGLMRHLVQSLQNQAEKMIELQPSSKATLLKWKNMKMHQLMAIKSILVSNELHQIDIFNLTKELQLLKEERFFPEMRKEATLLEKQISNHLLYEQKEIEKKKMKEDEGVRWVFDRLFLSITDNQQNWQKVASRLDQRQNGVITGPLLSDRLYVDFQRQQIGSSSNEQQSNEKIFLHIFNKSVFDLINQNISKVDPIQPSIECLRQIFFTAHAMIANQEIDEWRQEMMLWVCEIIEDQLFDEWLEEFIEFI